MSNGGGIGTGRIIAVAVVAGLLGVAASVLTGGSGPLLRSELGQRLFNAAATASAPVPPAGTPVAALGDVIPAIELPDLAGKPVALPKDFAGRPLLVNVWASWCGPCVEEMPELQRFAVQQPGNGVQVLGLALDDKAAVEDFLKRIPVHYPIVLENAGPADASVQLGNRKGLLPYSVLISADGRLLKQKLGPFDPGEIDDWARH